MTGLLCQTGYSLYLAWTSTTPRVVSNSTEILPPDVWSQIGDRTAEYRQALAAYRAHRDTCPVCKEKYPCRKDED